METANALRADSRLGLVRRRRRAGAPGGLRDRDAGTGRRILRLVGDPGGVRRAGRRLRRRGAWAGSRPRRAATGDRPVGHAGLFYRPAHWRRRQEPFAGAGGRADEADAGGGAGTSARRGVPRRQLLPRSQVRRCSQVRPAPKSPTLDEPAPAKSETAKSETFKSETAAAAHEIGGEGVARQKALSRPRLPKASRRRAAERPTI